MTIRQYLIFATTFLISCGTRNPQASHYSDNSDTKTDIPKAEEAWMNFDNNEQVSYVDLHQYGRLKLPGRWTYSDSQFPRYSSYKNSENHLLRLDMGLLDTMIFYSKGMAETELLTKLYAQGTKLWKEKETGQIQTIETNQDNIIAKLTIDPTKQIFFLCGIKDNRTMTLYLVPKTPNDLNDIGLLKNVFTKWQK